MKEKASLINELTEKVLNQLKDQNYMESSLMNYRRIYKRLRIFLIENGTDTYSKGNCSIIPRINKERRRSRTPTSQMKSHIRFVP